MKESQVRNRALAAVINHDLNALSALHQQCESIIKSFDPNTASYEQLAALGFTLHNIYNALENSFDQISRTCENHVVDNTRWHAELLNKMFLEIPEIRPLVIPSTCRELLNDLRGFRHLFRHSYEFQLNASKLYVLACSWVKQHQEVLQALDNFRRWLIDS